MDDNYILIIGAGPTGLTLANALACSRTPFRIIDARPGPTGDSKGLAVNVSSQYGLRIVGLKTLASSQGKAIKKLNIHWKGRRFSSINFNHLPTHICSLITQPQSETEQLLLENLAAFGHSVEWSTQAEDIVDDDSFPAAKIRKSDTSNEVARFHYIIGCDGKRSVVRKYVSPTFDGTEYQMHFILGDFEFESEFPNDEVQYFVYDDVFFLLVPIADNVWRAVVKYEGQPSQIPAKAQEIAGIINKHLGRTIIPNVSRWISKAPFYTKIVSKLQSGRLFLAGDSAHLYSPIGGTGMNTGIQDALNLAWKLSLTYKNVSSPELLRSYQEERLEVIRENAEAVNLSTQLISRQLLSHPLLTSLAPKMRNRNFLRKLVPSIYAGLNVSYSSNIKHPDGEIKCEINTAFLNMLNKISEDTNSTLYSKISIVVVGLIENIDSHIKVFNELHKTHPTLYHVIYSSEEASPSINRNYPPSCCTTYSFHPSEKIATGIYVIRPDGFTALHLSHKKISALPDCISKYFSLNKLPQPLKMEELPA